ncbi:MAG: glutamate racemase [Oligoflexia bacterium]|nr:glutamate racemase [Oligoflexia bacterium]
MDNFKIKIGLFDSGIGGFSILKELMNSNLDADYFYFADRENAPYGDKTGLFIQQRSLEIAKELLKKDIDLLVVACNSATTHSVVYLREHLQIPVVGVEPYINYLNKFPEEKGTFGLITTKATAQADKFIQLKDKLDPQGRVKHIVTEGLASLIEKRFSQEIDHHEFLGKLEELLESLKENQFNYLILGCTHYPLIKKEIEAILNLKTICPSPSIAQRVIGLLENRAKYHDGTTQQFFKYSERTGGNWSELSLKELSL